MTWNRNWVILSLLLLLVVCVRVRLLDLALERDEGESAYAGQLILHGVPPYKAAYNMNLPGTYAAYAGIMAVFGQSPAGIHFGLLLVNAASIVLVFILGRKLLDDTAGLAGAIAFALLSLSPSVRGLAGHATHFVTFFALGGFLLLVDACMEAKIQRGRPRPLIAPGTILGKSPIFAFFFSGLLFGLAFLMKEHGIFFCLFGVIYLLGFQYQQAARVRPAKTTRRRHVRRSKPSVVAPPRKSLLSQHVQKDAPVTPNIGNDPTGIGRSAPVSAAAGPSNEGHVENRNPFPVGAVAAGGARLSQPQPTPGAVSKASTTLQRSSLPLIEQFGIFITGLALPYLSVCLFFWCAGCFSQFWFWTVTYAREYAAAVPVDQAPGLLRLGLYSAIGPNLVFWLLACLGAVLIWFERRLDFNRRWLLTLFLLCSVGSTTVGFYFRRQDFIMLLPAMSLLVGAILSRSARVLKARKNKEIFFALPIVASFVIGIGAALVGNGLVWVGLSSADAMREMYNTTLFDDAAKLAAYIRTNSPPSARIAVLGSEPEIYFLSRRRGATGHIYMYPLMEKQLFASRMQQDTIDEIERAHPDYVVLVNHRLSWLQQPDSDRRISTWWQTYSDHLELVKRISGEGRKNDSAFGLLPGSRVGRANTFAVPGDDAADSPIPQYLLLYKRKSLD